MANENEKNLVPTSGNAVANVPTLEQRVIKIQFHLQSMGQSAIIIGQELTECKKEVPHGDWQNWLEKNFKLSYTVATRFMQIAERFSNVATSQLFSQSQMIELLALPVGEEEDFIAEKAAQGSPVEDMTVKKLREEIKHWKNKADEKTVEADNLKSENAQLLKDNKLKDEVNLRNADEVFKLKDEYKKLQQEKTVEITPPDYEENKKQIADLKKQIQELKSQEVSPLIIHKVEPPDDYWPMKKYVGELEKAVEELETTLAESQENSTVEVVPADYEQIKKQLTDLQAQQENFKIDIATSQALNQFFTAANFLHEHQDRLTNVLIGYIDSDSLSSQHISKLSEVSDLIKKIFSDISN